MATNPDRSSPKPAASLRERGHIYFFYRPRAEELVARGLDDVEELYMVLSPRGRDSYRLLIIGGTRLPAVAGGRDRRSWALVDKVASRPEEIEDELDPKTYLTKTHSERHRPAARPAGEGVYAIVRHRNHTHLAYALELPAPPGEVQRAGSPSFPSIHRTSWITRAPRSCWWGRARTSLRSSASRSTPSTRRKPRRRSSTI